MKGLAVILWIVTGFAVLAYFSGDLAAINGVIGAGVVALSFTVFAVAGHR